MVCVFFFKQKTAYEMRISDWSSDVCSSDLSDYAKGALERVEALIAQARAAGVPVLVDPKGDDYTRYRGATLVTPNRAEMQQAVGRWNSESQLTDSAQRLRAGPDLAALLITRSEQGMTLFNAPRREHAHAPTRKTDV